MTKAIYYPGCSLHSTAIEYNESTKAVLGAVGIEFEELADWNCCGATPAHATSEFLTSALPLRNLVNAERQVEGWGKAEGTGGGTGATGAAGGTGATGAAGGTGATGAAGGTGGAAAGRLAAAVRPDLLVPCAACYNSFRLAEYAVREGGQRGHELNHEMSRITGREWKGKVTVRHPLEVLARREGLTQLRGLTKKPLRGLKVASYYGCLLGRPSKIVSFEPNPEHPTSMDDILAAVGAEPVRWSRKTDCCGQSMSIAESELVTELVGRIVGAAREAGAAVIATACPLCAMNLDTRQTPPKPGETLLAVFFYTELVSVALGIGKPEAWWKRHIIDPKPALRVLEAKKSA